MRFKKLKLPFRFKKPVLALGSQAKNRICFVKDSLAWISPVYTDLSIPKDLASFQKNARYFLRRNPKIIAYDLHPEYASTKFAQELRAMGYELRAIQHHHAHIASCIVENGIKNQKVIGVAFDGTGLGEDNRLWGAEFLVCDYKSFKRRAHLEEIPLLGGERAILEPWRLAAAWLYRIYKDRFLNFNIAFVKGINRKDWQVLKKLYLSGFNAPQATSAGRLFDAVASLVLSKHQARFEAELAIALEKIAGALQGRLKSYPFKIIKDKEGYIIDPSLMFREIVLALKAKAPQGKIAYRFHLTVAAMICRVCNILRKENRVNKVVLSGGVFQNKLLLRLVLDLLYKAGFNVMTHNELSCNDSGIALGQAVIASYRS